MYTLGSGCVVPNILILTEVFDWKSETEWLCAKDFRALTPLRFLFKTKSIKSPQVGILDILEREAKALLHYATKMSQNISLSNPRAFSVSLTFHLSIAHELTLFWHVN